MTAHEFILTSSTWLGEGKIELNMADEPLDFCTKWNIAKKDESGKIECIQEIQVKGLSEIMHNQFLFFDMGPGSFSLELDNPHLGKNCRWRLDHRPSDCMGVSLAPNRF